MDSINVNANITNDTDTAVTLITESGGFTQITAKSTKCVKLLVVGAIYRGRTCKPISSGIVLKDAILEDAERDPGFFLNHIAFRFN